MKQIALCLLVVFALRSVALSEVPTSIFDDNWKPYAPQQAAPQPPVAATPSPLPTPTTTPTAGTPAPTPPTPDSTVAPSPKPAVPPPAPVVPRLAIPTAAAQAASWKLIKTDLYKVDIANAKSSAQKVELSEKLLAVARETTNDPVGKYVLLSQAKELAISSGDPPTAFQCLDELGKAYNIDYPAMKLELFAALARTVTTPTDCETVVAGLNQWADVQVKSDRYAQATKACDIAQEVARMNKNKALVDQTLLHQKQIGEIEAGYISNKATILSLASKPTDPAANLAAARFYCFIKGDWDKGLPMLALGSDVRLKTLAATELAGASDTDAQMAVGDGWWDIADKEKGSPRDRIRTHAAGFYDQALPSLSGLAKLKAEKRLKEAGTPAAHGPRVVDLLKLVDAQRDAVMGVWEMKPSGLLSDGSRNCRIEFPYQPPEEYDFRIVFTRSAGTDAIVQICAVQRWQFMWAIGARGGTQCRFELVGGHLEDNNPTTKKAAQWLNTGQEYTSVIKVRKSGVEAYFDGKLISAWKTDFSDMGLPDNWSLKHTDVIGVASQASPTIFRTIEVIEITGKGKILTQPDVGEK